MTCGAALDVKYSVPSQVIFVPLYTTTGKELAESVFITSCRSVSRCHQEMNWKMPFTVLLQNKIAMVLERYL